tara:strand:+ start:387 stop:662 length:276 start_codon:yes stop_codon:yes gene_type:complete
MSSNIVVEDHWLKPTLKHCKVWSYDKGFNGGYIADFKAIGQNIRLIGTPKQIYDWFLETKFEIKDSWKAELTDYHKQLYKRNCEKIVIIHL